jgi:hypothetical protein
MIRNIIGMGFVALFTLTSCGTSPSASSGNSSPTSQGTLTAVNGQVLNPHNLPATGTYEGAGLEMVVTETGATLNTGCRKGAVPTPITLTSDGSFNATGTMNPELPMNPPEKTPIVLEGKYSQQDQALSVAVTFGPQGDPQDYNLVLDAPKNLDVACPL